MQSGSFFSKNTVQGYIRHKVADCGYAALKIDRDIAFELPLKIKKPGVPNMLTSFLQNSVPTQEFYDYLVEGGYPYSYEEMRDNMMRLARNEEIQEAYKAYDLSRRAQDSNYAAPEVLQEIARIQEKVLHIWRFEDAGSEVLVPYVEGKGALPSSGERIDLLYNHDGHFEQLDLSSYNGNIPGQKLMPLGCSPIDNEEAYNDSYTESFSPPVPIVFHERQSLVNPASYFGPFIVYQETLGSIKEKMFFVLYYRTRGGASDAELIDLQYTNYTRGNPLPSFHDIVRHGERLGEGKGPWPKFFIIPEDYMTGGPLIQNNRIDITKKIEAFCVSKCSEFLAGSLQEQRQHNRNGLKITSDYLTYIAKMVTTDPSITSYLGRTELFVAMQALNLWDGDYSQYNRLLFYTTKESFCRDIVPFLKKLYIIVEENEAALSMLGQLFRSFMGSDLTSVDGLLANFRSDNSSPVINNNTMLLLLSFIEYGTTSVGDDNVFSNASAPAGDDNVVSDTGDGTTFVGDDDVFLNASAPPEGQVSSSEQPAVLTDFGSHSGFFGGEQPRVTVPVPVAVPVTGSVAVGVPFARLIDAIEATATYFTRRN